MVGAERLVPIVIVGSKANLEKGPLLNGEAYRHPGPFLVEIGVKIEGCLSCQSVRLPKAFTYEQ